MRRLQLPPYKKMFPAVAIIALLLKVPTSEGQQDNDPVSQPELSSETSITIIGQNVTLSCLSSRGSPPIDYKFFIGKHHLSTVPVQKINETAEFTFSVNNISDAGEYKCAAENNFTTPKKYSNGLNFTLVELVSQPELSSDTSFTIIGQSVTLSCLSSQGTLPIDYKFFRDTHHLSTVQVQNVNKTAKFTFNVNNISDAGEYKCAAENNFTTPKRYSNGLNVSLVERVSKPKLYSSTSLASMGQNVNLSCLSEYGSPPIKYSFFRGETLLSLITKTDSVPAVLTLNLNSTTDLGTYQCKAENMLSNMEKHSDGFNFTVRAETASSSGLVIGILVLCLVVLFLILAISLWTLPRYKARKRASFKATHVPSEKETGSTTSKEFTKDPGNCRTMEQQLEMSSMRSESWDSDSSCGSTEIDVPDVEYIAVFTTNGRKVVEQEEATAEYSEILIRKDN